MKIKFSLRDLFWLMIVAGLATGWVLEARRPKYNKLNAAKVDGFDRAVRLLLEKSNVLITVSDNGTITEFTRYP